MDKDFQDRHRELLPALHLHKQHCQQSCRGTYVFELKVTDNASATGTDNVTVVVNPASTTLAIPGRIQAESYTTMSGIQTQATGDGGTGLNVGYIDQGDWMDYSVNVATTRYLHC